MSSNYEYTDEELQDAEDAGYDFALDAISNGITFSEVRGCCFDLVGGDEFLADHAFEGVLRAFKEKKMLR